ncbi:alpha/beta hydrolase [Bacillus pseudomycoides]|uniref:Esterase family protein n=1 Tax=Bacillus pseudomycoides TaxID=64104 RepID=A0ABD6TFK3_9BACI|nr:alpha/beta hydrolase-fold protein [Bacillus pseudomycoides]EEM12215.1 Esterase [Bacillus pseudomycoides]PEP87024.1 esterase family protein [Bacillus pseudomycoides]PGF08093.1 esterase family protein [Bacillus pseudomycoides]PHF04700.1 esterase family protein [Bacillus pseudomycoides]
MNQATGRIEELSFYSTSLQEEITLLVYLPANYTPLHKHTVVIAQDGRDYFQLGKAHRVIERLRENEEIDRTIIVGIPYKNVHDRKEKYFPNDVKNSAYIRFLAHELVPYIDENYPTYQMGKGRVLIGDSLGGTVSFMTALMYPHTFGKVVMQSPFVDETVLSLAKDFTEPHALEIYHVIGTEETAVKRTDGQVSDFVEPNRELHALLTERNFITHYEEFKGNHTWKYWQNDLPKAFSYILSMK